MVDYPDERTCDNCGQTIFVYLGKKPPHNEYARNSMRHINFNAGEKMDFHQCRNWKGSSAEKKPSTIPEQTRPLSKDSSTYKVETKEDITFKNASDVLAFERTFKVLEVTISKSRKANEKTIAQLAPYENIDYFVSLKAEVELNCDVQVLIQKKFAEISQAIDSEIIADRLRLSGMKEQ